MVKKRLARGIRARDEKGSGNNNGYVSPADLESREFGNCQIPPKFQLWHHNSAGLCIPGTHKCINVLPIQMECIITQN